MVFQRRPKSYYSAAKIFGGVTGATVTVEGANKDISEYNSKPPSEPIFKTIPEQKIASVALEIIQQQFERNVKMVYLTLKIRT